MQMLAPMIAVGSIAVIQYFLCQKSAFLFRTSASQKR